MLEQKKSGGLTIIDASGDDGFEYMECCSDVAFGDSWLFFKKHYG